MKDGLRGIYSTLFCDYYLEGEFLDHSYTRIVVAHGYLDMKLKLFELRCLPEMYQVVVI